MKRNPTTRWLAAAGAAAALALACSQAPAAPREVPGPDRTEVLIGVIGSNDLGFRSGTITPTLRHLEKSLPRYRFRIVDIPSHQAVDLIHRTRPDFIVGPSDVFFTLINTAGAQALVTRKSVWARDGGASVGSAIVVKSGNTAIRSLADLRGRKIAASLPDSLGGWLAFTGELARSGYDPATFISGANFLSYEYPAVFESVIDGRADAGILTACQLESAEASGLLEPGLLRVINEKDDGAIACRHSTGLYPGQTFGVLDYSRPELVKEIALALLSMPPQPTFSWQVAGQFHAVSRLYQDLRIGPFAEKPWTLADFIRRYFWYFAGALGLALFLVLNEIRLNRLVARRTSALERSLEENRRLADTERQARERLSVLERRSLVSHMGSMIAHELKQPLAAMRNYCEVARIRLEALDSPPVEELLLALSREVERVNAIVDRVRSYAKKAPQSHSPADLSEVARRAAGNFRNYQEYARVRPALRLELEPGSRVDGDALELEILVLNLMKNAARAEQGVESPEIRLQVKRTAEGVRMRVEDNGPRLTDEQFERLQHASDSTSAEGLGLGLPIVRSIADAHSADLSVTRLEPRGLRFEILFDASAQAPAGGAPEKNHA